MSLRRLDWCIRGFEARPRMSGPGLEHAYVSTNGVTLHVARAGPADGPLIILLHGFPEFWYAWRHYLEALAAAGFRVLAPDQRGYNLSDKPLRVDDYHLDILAQDVVGLIDGEGRKKACIVGHDWGAAVAWWVAQEHADRVSHLSVLNVPHPEVLRRTLFSGEIAQLRKSWYMFFFQLPWLPEQFFLRQQGQWAFERMRSIGRPDAFSDADADAYREAWAQAGAPRGMLDWYRAALRFARGPRPERLGVEVPTQIIWGRQDTLLSDALAEQSLGLCKDAKVVWFDDATHWVLHEEREAVIAALKEFVS